MKDQVLCVDYFVVNIDDRPGTGAELWKQLAKQGVNLLATHAFPSGPGKTQVDLVPENPDAFRKAASKLGLSVTGPKLAFLVHGADKPGAVGELMDRLGQKQINVRASSGADRGRQSLRPDHLGRARRRRSGHARARRVSRRAPSGLRRESRGEATL